ncbi:hypothetical protein A2454_04530 [Candidatus Peribacteria bacterium RIFOXYC2_FULL_55_14]|nr:MAG: hypothetical protein UY87_C0086G0008 [Candidatus Peribacteria bacterium GW2011_GWC2_54_8]OGJ70977.1 MAG: hypothetical protein A2198_01055 [Candidatus Peribacteria bacterium RIFOXYA1_FULL_56_14]OGJ74271.1 MAG: hypothetical protein A2384_06090 [Candidatus Peribacteria bacterium RIFOXYB1_FULL_54_35]OGJ75194.1 MAG: hypothetical protein A2217_05710 [Candidatus Peribacteria bacterium RIFOXYA2_FULL_55_28]OGJ75889.1 MAG: hypothetical protein A2327_03235 [Candidatus Peribacteria bacterium RIFOXY
MRTSTFVVFSACLAVFLAACQMLEKEPMKIGYIGPLTGDASAYGVDTLNAVKMKVEEVNAAGGIGGRQVQLVAEDGRCTGGDAANAARKLIDIDKVVAIIGGQCSSETLGAAPIAEAAGIVQVSPVSSSPDVADAGDFIFRTYPSDALKGIDIAEYFGEKGYTKVAIMTENTDYCVGIRDSIKAALPEGAEVVFDELTEPGVKDFRSLITRLEDMEFDVFVPNAQSDAVLGAMAQQMREQGFEQPMVSQDIADSNNLPSIAGEAVEGMRMFNVSSLLGEEARTEGARPFAEKFRELHGDPQQNMGFAVLAYDAAGVLLEAIAAVGTEGTAIRDYLYGLQAYEGAAGTFRFDAKGEVVGIGNVQKRFENGKIVEGVVTEETVEETGTGADTDVTE